MALAKSQVQVSITAGLAQGFSSTFQAANAKMAGLRQAVSETGKAVASIDSYRKQQSAVNQTKQVWESAREKANRFADAIRAQGAPTKVQTRELKALEKSADRAGEAFGREKVKLVDMGRALQKAGIETGKLSQEYKRLTAIVKEAENKQLKMERSLMRQQRILSAMGGTWQTIGKTVASAAAGAAVLSGPTRKALTYDEQISYMADTAAAGEGPAAYKAARTKVSDGVTAALNYGGGKREDSAAALNTMIASGKFEFDEAITQLREVTRTAFAAGASADDIAKTAIAMKNFGINEMGPAFDQMMRAGQLGGFELRDMAKNLPSQLAYAKAAGYSGSKDLSKLLAWNQAAMSTAGTPEEAGNNVINSLQKMSSRELTDRLAKSVIVRKGDPYTIGKKGQKQFDWTGYLLRARKNDQDPARAMTELVDRELQGDKRYKSLQKQAASSKDKSPEKIAAIDGMTNILMGSKMGDFFTDRQAALGMLAAYYQKDYMAAIEKGVNESGGIVAASSQNIRGEGFAKVIDGGNAIDRANEQTYNQLAGPMGKMLDYTVGLTKEYPRLTTAVYGVTAGMTALAAMVGVWGLTGRALSAGGAAAGAGAAASAAAGGASAAGAGAAGAAAGAGTAAAAARLMAGPMAATVGIAGLTTSEEDDELRTGKARHAALIEKHGQATVDEARKKYQPWYQFGGGYASENEKWVQQLLADRAASPSAAPGLAASALSQASGVPASDPSMPLVAKVVESSTAAADAAKAASEAATAAQTRPNFTQHNSYQISVTAPTNDPTGLAAMLDQKMRERERDAAAAGRANFMNQPRF